MLKPDDTKEVQEIEKDWYFTWGFGQGYDNCYTIMFGTSETARQQMTRIYGDKWGFQYKSAEDAGVKKYNLKRIY